MKNWKIILMIVTSSIVATSAGYTMLIPFLPIYLMKELGVSEGEIQLWTGAIFSITFLISSIMAPVWGKIADKKGQKMMAMRASICLTITYFLGGMVTTPEQLLGVRIIQGFAAGVWSMCLAIVSSSVPKDKLGVSLGTLQAGQTVGHVIGPLVGGSLATLVGMRTSFFVASSLLFLITVVFYFFVPEPPKKAQVEKKKESGLLRRPIVLELLGCFCIVKLVTMLIQPILTLYVAKLTNGEGNVVFLGGLIFSIIGVASAITAPMWGGFGQKYGYYTALSMSAITSAFACAACAFPKEIMSFGIMNFLYGLLFAGALPALSAALADCTSVEERGSAFGYMFSAQQFGAMIGPLLGGFVATCFSMKAVFYTSGIILLILGIVVMAKHRIFVKHEI